MRARQTMGDWGNGMSECDGVSDRLVLGQCRVSIDSLGQKKGKKELLRVFERVLLTNEYSTRSNRVCRSEMSAIRSWTKLGEETTRGVYWTEYWIGVEEAAERC